MVPSEKKREKSIGWFAVKLQECRLARLVPGCLVSLPGNFAASASIIRFI